MWNEVIELRKALLRHFNKTFQNFQKVITEFSEKSLQTAEESIKISAF